MFGFRAAYVFDASQTEGAELPEFSRFSGDPGERLSLLKGLVADRGIELRYEESLGGAERISHAEHAGARRVANISPI